MLAETNGDEVLEQLPHVDHEHAGVSRADLIDERVAAKRAQPQAEGGL